MGGDIRSSWRGAKQSWPHPRNLGVKRLDPNGLPHKRGCSMKDEETKTGDRENPAPKGILPTREQRRVTHTAPPGQRERNLTVGFYTNLKTNNQNPWEITFLKTLWHNQQLFDNTHSDSCGLKVRNQNKFRPGIKIWSQRSLTCWVTLGFRKADAY